MFWTIPIPPSAIDVSPGSGQARFHMANVAVPDFHDFFNAVSPSPDPAPVPSHVSFDVRWQGGGQRQKISDTTFDFAGEYVSGDAHITFSAYNNGTGVTYTAVADGQKTVSAGVGRERNGVFFQ